jgi:hypothetical protein
MKAALIEMALALAALMGSTAARCRAETIIDADFSQASFADLGWQAKGDWDVFKYPAEAANNPGAVARFAANKPAGTLTKTFDEIKNPQLSLSLDYGWGWGDAAQPADAISLMLLDVHGNGYVFEVTPRKAAQYLRNLTMILADDGQDSQPSPATTFGELRYAIPEQPATVHELLLQKSDGTFALVVWGERLKGSDEVTVQLGETFSAVKVYDPTVGAEPIETAAVVDSLKLTLSDHPLVVMLGGK